METINDSEQKVLIEYPCNWCYKIIAESKELLDGAAKEIFQTREHTVTPSHKSKGGKYVSMNLDVFILDEEDRLSVFESLKRHKNIKMVL